MPLIMDEGIDQNGLDAAAAAVAMDGEGMGHDINMDDLFGAEPMNLPMAKGLPRRLTELRDTGCCQRIGWSKYGPIVAISPDSRELHSYCITRDNKSSKWQLSKPVSLKIPPSHKTPFKHVSWSFMGSDLAVVDTSGRILMYNCALGHAHLDIRKDSASDPSDEMNAVVGMHWLPLYPQAQKVTAYWSAQSENGKWTWNRDDHRSTGPSNPLESKTALLAMTRGGRLRLLYQLADSSWREFSSAVDDMLFNHEHCLTHASFAPDRDDGLLLVTYDTHAYLRLYKVKIDWGQPKDAPEGQTQQPQHSKVINPSMKVTCLKVDTYCLPTGSDQADADLTGFGTADNTQYMLTHLALVAGPLDRGEQHLPSIITVFKHVPSILPSLTGAPHPAPLSATSLIWVWELQPSLRGGLSGAIDQLAAKKKSSDAVKPRQFLNIKRHSNTPIHNVVLSVTPLRYNTVLAISMADGSVEFLRRDSMESIQADYNFSEVYSLPQSGFSFVSTEPVTHTELSPNGCVAVYQDSEGALKLRTMESTTTALDNPGDDARRTAMATTLALQWSSGLLQFKSCLDDILSLMPANPDADLMYEFVEQAYAAIGINLDFSSDDPQKATVMLFRTPWLQKLMGAQALLGQGRKGQRTMSAKLAFVTLNTRLAAFVIMMVFRTDQSLKSDVALSLCGMVQWSLDFMVYILQEIDRLSEHLRALPADPANPNPFANKAAIESYLAAENSPALLLLLCSVSRVLIRMICRPLRHGWIHCINGAKTATTPQARMHFLKAIDIFQKSPVCTNLSQQGQQGSVPGIAFETFSGQVEVAVKEAYASAGVTEAQRAKAEKEMFIRARIPDALVPVIAKVLTEIWPRFMQQPGVDLGRIFKQDVAWVGFTEDRYTRTWQTRHCVDVVRKIILPVATTAGQGNAAKTRRCARCGSRMEDIQPGPQWPGWVIGSMKNCICLGNWGEVE